MGREIGHNAFCMCNKCKLEIPTNYAELFLKEREYQMITMTRRYYMGSLSLRHGNPPLKLISEAIDEAQKFLENNPNYEERYIVEVVKVVRRQRTPIIVENVCE